MTAVTPPSETTAVAKAIRKIGIKIAVVSDIHLGHRRNDAADIVRQLYAAFPDNAQTAELDILFIAGDLFDRLLDLPNLNVTVIQIWMRDLIRICAKNNTKIRILEGTASHDWKQSEMFISTARVVDTTCDIQFVKTVHIEYMEEFDMNVLYLPDDWNHDHNDTLIEIKELMASKGLQTVELGIFHGNFEHQLPPAAKNAPKHDSTEYLKLVSGVIFIGHHHTFSCFQRIYAQGSFDRLAHNEEEPKGHCRAIRRNDRTWDVWFVENKLARRYVTIDCTDLTIEETLEKAKLCEGLPAGSYVRLQAPKGHPVMSDLASFIRLYPDMNWTKDPKKPVTAEEDKLSISEILSLHYTPIHIDRHNVEDLVMERIRRTYGDNPTLIANARTNLLEHI